VLLIIIPANLIGADKTISESNNGYLLIIKLEFDSYPGDFRISPSKLKYNKDFAYSLTLDDGLSDAYHYAYFLLNGGYNNANQTIYPGLYYTDGCGNLIPFRAGISWYSVNDEDLDLHDGSISLFMTWLQLSEVYSNGWDVFNHGYSSIYNEPGINYGYEVSENVQYVKNKTGIDLHHFVVPSNDNNYFEPAFSNGMKAIYGAFDEFQGFDSGIEVDAEIDLNNFRLYRRLISDDRVDSDNILDFINGIDVLTNNGENHVWCNEFTHSVGEEQTGASLLFPLFSYYMQELERLYGRLGKDNMWMAPLQEVYEYLIVRDNAEIAWLREGNEITVYIDFSEVPEYLRRNSLSLVVESESNFSDPQFSHPLNYSYTGNGSSKLINLEWESGVFNNTGKFPEQNQSFSEIEIFPNPGKSFINIYSQSGFNTDIMDISFYNTSGARMHNISIPVKQNDHLIGIHIPESFSEGLYYLILRNDNNIIFTHRVVINR